MLPVVMIVVNELVFIGHEKSIDYIYSINMSGRFNLSLALVLLLTCHVHAIVTYEPAPPINSTFISKLYNSPADSKLILSSKLEALKITQSVVNGTPVSTFNLTAYNRSAVGSWSFYQYSLPGAWNHVQSSQVSLSCSVVMESNTHMLGLLSFGGAPPELRMVGTIPLSTLSQDNITISQIADAIIVGEYCRVLAFTSSSNQTAVYRANQAFTEINLVLLPSDWRIQAVALDLMYAISSNKLYRYNRDTFQYQEIYTFKTHQHYNLKTSGDRILVTAINSTVINDSFVPPLLSNDYKVYVFNYKDQRLVKIGEIPITGHVDYHLPSVFSSPLLTKFGFGYSTSPGSPTTIVAKHIDYTQNLMIDLTWQDPIRYMQTVQRIDALRELDFNDYFLVVRNSTNFNTSDPARRPYELAYQFSGTKVLFLRDRDLLWNSTVDLNANTTTLNGAATEEIDRFFKTFVDFTQTDRLVIINLYVESAGVYVVKKFDYGSLQFNLRIITPPTPAFISFEEPPHLDAYSLSGGFNWVYINRVANNTNVTVALMNNATSNHVVFMSQAFPGQWHMLYENSQCQIAKEGDLFSSMFTIILYHQNNQTVSGIDITTLVHSLSGIGNNTVWGASHDCLRISINNQLFIRDPNSGAFSPVTGNIRAIDSNLTTIISADDGNLYRLNPQTASFSLIFTPPVAFPVSAKIRTFEGNMIIWATNTTSSWVFAFRNEPASAPALCLNYSVNTFSAPPKVFMSPNLTKVIIIGPTLRPNTSAPVTRADTYFIDYHNTTFRNISFPVPIADPAKIVIDLGQSFLYLRQVNDSVNETNPPQEFAFFFSRDTALIKAYTRNLTFPANVEWKRTLIYRSPEGKHFLFTETLEGASAPKTRVVKAVEINGEQAALNSGDNPTFTAQMENGQVRLCPPGCSNCDCSGCLSGYVMETSSSSCRPCPPACLTCSSSNSSICEACITGSFLNGTNQCQPCAPGCISCTSSSSCNVCPPGQYNGGSQCQDCPLNCFNCSDANTCITCRKGFTITSSKTCRGCSYSCSDCLADNITSCTACAKGLQLLNSVCSPCPDRCKECSNNVCAVCVDGYTSNSAGVCVTKCQLPCLTCQDNQPTYCLSCQSGSTVSGGVCALDLSCNADSSCSNCGQGLNYVLALSSAGATCAACPSLANCVQCDSVNNYKCSICKNSFYIDAAGVCNGCNSNCTSCKSSTVCTGCAPGFTLMEGYSEGTCLQCKTPCAACQSSPDYCTSCVSGFTKKGWKCRNNTYIGFRFVLQGTPSDVMALIDAIVAGILQILKENSTNIEAVTFETISSGSTVMSGTASTSGSTSVASGSATLAAGLAAGIPGVGMSVSGVETTAYGGTTPQTETSSSTNVGLIVGLVVGLSAAVAIVIIVVVILKRSKVEAVCPIEGNTVLVEQVGEKNLENSGLDISGKIGTNDLFEIEKI